MRTEELDEILSRVGAELYPPEDLKPLQREAWLEIVGTIRGLKQQNLTLIRIASEAGGRYKAVAAEFDTLLNSEGSVLSSLMMAGEDGKERVHPAVALVERFQKSYTDALRHLGASPTKVIKANL